MQTFLPYEDFYKSAKCLDRARLGKQRMETKQILDVVLQPTVVCPWCNGHGSALECKCHNKGFYYKGWYKHPAVQMWNGYPEMLALYGHVVCQEWINRGYKDNLADYFIEHCKNILPSSPTPKWLGNEVFHASHRSNLLRKMPEYYNKFGWKEPNDLEYFWPTKEGY